MKIKHYDNVVSVKRRYGNQYIVKYKDSDNNIISDTIVSYSLSKLYNIHSITIRNGKIYCCLDYDNQFYYTCYDCFGDIISFLEYNNQTRFYNDFYQFKKMYDYGMFKDVPLYQLKEFMLYNKFNDLLYYINTMSHRNRVPSKKVQKIINNILLNLNILQYNKFNKKLTVNKEFK